MHNFQIGQEVVRTTDKHNGMRVGDRDTITRLNWTRPGTLYSISLCRFGDGHSPNSLRPVTDAPAAPASAPDPRINPNNWLEAIPFKTINLYCCGIKEFHGLQGNGRYERDKKGSTVRMHEATPLDVLKAMCMYARQTASQHVDANADDPYYRFRPFMIFSVARPPTSSELSYTMGQDISKLIAEHDLGTVWASGWEHNGNSGNLVQMYVWTVHKNVLKAFIDDQHP